MILRRAIGHLSSLCKTLAASLLLSSTVMAQTVLLDEVRTVSNGATPYEQSVKLSAGGAYRVELIDQNAGELNAEAVRQPMVSVKAAVTSGNTVLGTTTMATGTASGHIDFDVAANTEIVIRIVGKQATGKSGSVGVRLLAGGTTEVNQFVAAFSPPPTEIPGYRTFNVESFAPESTGTYSVELEDLRLPGALVELKAVVTRSGSVVANLDALGGPSTASFAVSSTELPYAITVRGEANQSVNAGLIGLRVRNTATGTIVFSRVYTVGTVAQIGSVTLDAGAHALSFSDFQFPGRAR